jgi:diguanylate cyclase (GGDEF)-like protein
MPEAGVAPAAVAPPGQPAAGTARVLVLAAVLAGTALALTAGPIRAFDGPAGFVVPWIVLAVAYAASESFPIHLEHRREAVSITLSSVPLVVGLYAAGPVGLVAARVLGSAASLVLHRRQRGFKLALNLAQMWLETAVGVCVFRALGGGDPTDVSSWAAAFAAAMAGDAVQTASLTAAISLYERRWQPAVLASLLPGTVANLVDAALALVVVVLLDAQPLAVLLLGVVALLLLGSYRVHSSLREKHQTLEQLYEFSVTMAAAVRDGALEAAVLERAVEVLHADEAWLVLCPPEGEPQLTRLAAGAGIQTGVLPAGGPEAAAHRHVHDAGDVELVDLPGGREGIAAPLTGPSGRLGTLAVVERSGEVRHFSAGDVRVFTTLANHAAAALENAGLVVRLREQAAANEHAALHDSLTGLPNRTLFHRRLAANLDAGEPVAVLLLDLDRFKEVNDTLGHHHGDELLREVGSRLRSTLRERDTVARLGGDEFAILLPGIVGQDTAVAIARTVLTVLQRPFAVAEIDIDVDASIGVAIAGEHGTDSSELLQRADVAMYAAKLDQTAVEVYQQESDAYTPERLALVRELRQAIEAGALEVHYQPQVSLLGGDVVGVEALVRWHREGAGWARPDEFIPVAERTGLIGALTSHVLETSLAQLAVWRAAGWPLRLSVNLSARSLLQRDLVDEVAGALRRTGVPPEALCLELTESSVMADPRRTTEALNRLRDLGITIAVDDFGTGHSSLSYLRSLPVAEIKIDKSFVLALATSPGDEAIVRSIVDLAHNLGLPVVAEGIEDEATARILRDISCDVAQGYHFGRPVPAADLGAWLLDRTPVATNVVPLPLPLSGGRAS